MRANYSNDRVGTKYALDNFGGAVPLPDSVLFPSGFSSTNGVFQLIHPGRGRDTQGKYATDEQRQINLVDNLSVTTGQPSDEVWRGLSLARAFHQSVRPTVNLRILRDDALRPEELFPERLSFGGTYRLPKSNALLSHNFSLYGQDTWKITPRLTRDLWLAVGRQSAAEGQEPRRTIHSR